MYLANHPISITLTAYMAFLLLITIARGHSLSSANADISDSLNEINLKNWIGICILVFPLLVLRNEKLFTASLPAQVTGIQVLILALLKIPVILISFRNSNQASSSLQQKNMQVSPLIVSQIASYLAIRIPFLIMYECFFRGLLLSLCLSRFDIPIAILINVILYALTHVFSNKKELIGSIPFGIILCALCIWWHSAVPAIILHLALAVPYEIRLLLLRTSLSKIRQL